MKLPLLLQPEKKHNSSGEKGHGEENCREREKPAAEDEKSFSCWQERANLIGEGCPDPCHLYMEAYVKIVVLKRSGQDSASFELVDDKYTFGR